MGTWRDPFQRDLSIEGGDYLLDPNEIIGFIQTAYYEGADWQVRLKDWAKNLDFNENPVQLFSNENLSRWRTGRNIYGSDWPVEQPRVGESPRRGAHPVTVFLGQLADYLPTDVSLFTIVSLRNQSDFLGSLAAQAGVKTVPVEQVIRREDAFLNFYSLVTELEKVRGASHHLTLLFEDGVEHNFKKIVDFAGLAPREGTFKYGGGSYENVKRTGEETWKMNMGVQHFYRDSRVFLWLRQYFRRKVPRLFPAMRVLNRLVFNTLVAIHKKIFHARRLSTSLYKEDRVKIRAHCALSNARLAQHLERDLISLGY